MKILISILFIFLIQSTKAQIVNTISPDRSNMYFHGLDSVIKIINKNIKIQRIIVRGGSHIQNFPDSVNGIVLLKDINAREYQKLKLKEGDVLVVIRQVSIIRDEHSIGYLTTGKSGPLEDWLYAFYYKYDPETQSYFLREIKKGMAI